MTATPDGRPVPPAHADERTVLTAWLDFHRSTVALKCAGLDDTQARRTAVVPSSMTMIGLIQHMAEIERNWFSRVFADEDVALLFGDHGGFGFTLDPDRTLEEALATWQAEVERSRELIVRSARRPRQAVGGERRRPRRGQCVPALDPDPHDRGVRPSQRSRGPDTRSRRRRHGR